MARRTNELFIGADKLNVEGRNIKHPALIKLYASVNINKIKENPIQLYGIDLETNHITAELKLLGFWNGNSYRHYTKDFLQVLFSWVKLAYRQERSLAYWNKLDPFILFKQFVLRLPATEQIKTLERYGHTSGEWDKKEGKWKSGYDPVVEISFHDIHFGIRNVVRSSVQFFFYRTGDLDLKTVWAFDIAQLYQNGLEAEATKKLPYYSKVDKTAHLVDWVRFESDSDYRNNVVLKSNELDSRAVYDLGMMIQEEFKTAFKWYSNTLVSQGSFARSAIVASRTNKYKLMFPDDDEKVAKLLIEDINSIPFMNYYDEWASKFGADTLKDMYCLIMEAYSGGMIEAYRYGYAKEGYIADLTQAYPATIMELYDLRNAILTKGTGIPPHVDFSYCFIRGEVDIPLTVNFHPITVKHPINKETNIRANGNYRASYTLEERDYLERLGTTFKNETWYNIQTEGKPSVLAETAKEFTDLRAYLRSINNNAEYMAKSASASMYGIEFEAVDTYLDINGEIVKGGYRAGEFFNPIYATIITSRTRLKLSEASTIIEEAGGHVTLIMTDSVMWEGTAEMLPPELWRETKTVGYFEKPTLIKDIVCLGSGRYGYKTKSKKTGLWDSVVSKKRGLNAVEIHYPTGVVLDDFNWLNALKIMEQTGKDKIEIKVRTLISVGLVLHNNSYTILDLGRVIEETREVDCIVGKSKRFYSDDLKNPKMLAVGMVDTQTIYLSKGMYGNNEVIDQTLPELRRMVMEKELITGKEKRTRNVNKASKKYYAKKSGDIKDKLKQVYQQLRDYGYSAYESKKMSSWSIEKIKNKLMEDQKI